MFFAKKMVFCFFSFPWKQGQLGLCYERLNLFSLTAFSLFFILLLLFFKEYLYLLCNLIWQGSPWKPRGLEEGLPKIINI